MTLEDIEEMFGLWGVTVVMCLMIACAAGLTHLIWGWVNAEANEPKSGIITEMEHDWEDGTYCVWYEHEYQGEGDECVSKKEYEKYQVGDEFSKGDLSGKLSRKSCRHFQRDFSEKLSKNS